MLSLLSDSCKGYEAAALRLAVDAQSQGLGTGLATAPRQGLAFESGLPLSTAPITTAPLTTTPLALRVVGVMRRLILSLVMTAPTFDAQLMQVIIDLTRAHTHLTGAY